MKTNIKIDDAFDLIMKSAEVELKNIANRYRLILGVANGRVATQIESIKMKFDLANQLLDAYCEFYKGKSRSYDLFTNEIMSLQNLSDAQANRELRIRFIEFNQIQIPSFPRFKKSKYVDLIEYSEEEETAFSTIRDLLNKFRQINYTCKEESFNNKTNHFEYHESIEEDLIEKNTKYCSDEQATMFIALGLIVQGLHNLFETDGTIVHADSAIQSETLDNYFSSIKNDLRFTKNGIEVNIEKLKRKMGFDSTLASIVIKPVLKRPIDPPIEDAVDNPNAYKKLVTIATEGVPAEYDDALRNNFN